MTKINSTQVRQTNFGLSIARKNRKGQLESLPGSVDDNESRMTGFLIETGKDNIGME
jgi:hypothetical protein